MKNYYIYHLSESIREGGMSRNNAFYKRVSDFDTLKINVFSENKIKRFWFSIKTINVLFFSRNRSVFIHQQSLWVLFPIFFMKIGFIREVVFCLLKIVSNRNKLIIEVNDLVYEQSKDLELTVDDFFSFLQDELYTIENCNYIFASNEMKSYVVSKYSLDSNKSDVVLNGAPVLCDYSSSYDNEEWMSSDKIKFVYAGSLNKGRQIEKLIDLFGDEKNILLIILGSEGEWLKHIPLKENIIYLGNFEEKTAHYLVSKCDIGIIPYDEKRFYYNLCYPTKVSFYLTAGIPILSTPLKEIRNVFIDKDVILFKPFLKWKNLLKIINKEEIINMKKSVFLIQNKYHWSYLLRNLDL